jgi:hypothetical protein
MRIEFQFKTADSLVDECPARYKVIDGKGGYVIQGKRLDDATRAMLRQIANDEDAVWVPADIVERIM